MQELSLTKLKQFAALRDKKARIAEGMYLAEGTKLVQEALQQPFKPIAIVVSDSFPHPPTGNLPCPVFVAQQAKYARLTDQTTPEGILAVMPLPKQVLPQTPTGPAFILSAVQDPGNLGTLLRIADWFGFRAIYTSTQTVDAFNPKVVRASMGSLFRVPVYEIDSLSEFITVNVANVYAATLGGTPLSTLQIPRSSMLLLGNEANGLSAELLRIPNLKTVSIEGGGGAESLNVAIAGGILAYSLGRA
jgi:RNA methyltransferase, TrmH family